MQKGKSVPKRMSMIEFSKEYHSKDRCLDDLWKRRCEIGFVCSKCNCSDGYTIEKRRLWQCKACKHQMKILSGTVFENSKLDLEKWYWAVLLQPFGITIIRVGNHSITTGILLNEGKTHVEDAYDMSSIFPHIHTDGVYYFRTKDNSIYAPVSNFSMAAVFEIGRLINEQKLSDVPIEFASFYRDSSS